MGFLGAAQVGKFANINTTVIGAYDQPKVRLPGAGGAPEIAASAREVLIILRQSRRTFVEKVEFITSPGFLNGGDERGRLGIPGAGPKQPAMRAETGRRVGATGSRGRWPSWLCCSFWTE